MINIVKISFNVTLDKPVHCDKTIFNLVKRSVAVHIRQSHKIHLETSVHMSIPKSLADFYYNYG